MSDLWRYEGKRVVVTGCASGMGQEAARELIDLGAHVVGLDIAEPTVAVKEFRRLDLSDPASVDAVAAAVGGPVHALFNIAGISSGAAPPLKVAEVNILGPRRLTEALLPTMEAGSAIAGVSSLAAAGYASNIPTVQEFLATGARGSGVPRDGFAAGRAWLEAHPDALGNGYNFAKQAIIVWTMMQGVELGQRGIRINCIGPTVTDTPFLADTIKTYGEGFIDAFPKPLGRVSKPEEQARALLFLNSDAASYITGNGPVDRRRLHGRRHHRAHQDRVARLESSSSPGSRPISNRHTAVGVTGFNSAPLSVRPTRSRVPSVISTISTDRSPGLEAAPQVVVTRQCRRSPSLRATMASTQAAGTAGPRWRRTSSCDPTSPVNAASSSPGSTFSEPGRAPASGRGPSPTSAARRATRNDVPKERISSSPSSPGTARTVTSGVIQPGPSVAGPGPSWW